MKKLFLGLTLAMMACWACGDATKEKKNEVKVEKAGQPEQKVEKIDSTELKRRQQEIIKQDSIQRAEEEKNTRIKQECATKVVFLENFYADYFKNPNAAVKQYSTDRLLSELRSVAHQYEGNAMPIWVFASGNGASNVSYKVNIPSDERSNVFNVTINAGGQVSNVYAIWTDREAEAFTLQCDEVSEVRWFNFDELFDLIARGGIKHCIYREELELLRAMIT